MAHGNTSQNTGSPALSWILAIGLNVVAPILTYNQLHSHGFGDFAALMISAVWPVVDTVIYLSLYRRIDEFAVITLIFMAMTCIVTLVGPHSARLLLVKDSFITGLFGVVCLLSLMAPRPLMFYFGRKFATGGSPEKIAWFNGLWKFEGFRRIQRNLTLTWGIAYIAEAALRVFLSYTLSTSTMVTINSVLAYAVTGGLIWWTISYSKRAAAKSRAAREREEADEMTREAAQAGR